MGQEGLRSSSNDSEEQDTGSKMAPGDRKHLALEAAGMGNT